MIDRFEAGKWYTYTKGSKRPGYFNESGAMDFLLDGTPFTRNEHGRIKGDVLGRDWYIREEDEDLVDFPPNVSRICHDIMDCTTLPIEKRRIAVNEVFKAFTGGGISSSSSLTLDGLFTWSSNYYILGQVCHEVKDFLKGKTSSSTSSPIEGDAPDPFASFLSASTRAYAWDKILSQCGRVL